MPEEAPISSATMTYVHAQPSTRRSASAISGAAPGIKDAADDAVFARTQRVGGFNEITPRAADDDGDHQGNLKDSADEDDEDFLQLTDAGPENEQGNECGGRQITAERYERLEEGFDGLVSAHTDAERYGDKRCQKKSGQHTPDGHPDILGKAVFGKEQPSFAQHGCRAGEKGRGDETKIGNEPPESDENDKK